MIDRTTYEVTKSEIECRYIEAVHDAEEARDQAVAAIELLWATHGEESNGNPKRPAKPLPFATGPGENRNSSLAGYAGLSLVDGVRKAVRIVESPFSRSDVMDWLSANLPELRAHDREISVATALSRLVGQDIEVEEKGAGRRPAKYRTIEIEVADLLKEVAVSSAHAAGG